MSIEPIAIVKFCMQRSSEDHHQEQAI